MAGTVRPSVPLSVILAATGGDENALACYGIDDTQITLREKAVICNENELLERFHTLQNN